MNGKYQKGKLVNNQLTALSYRGKGEIPTSFQVISYGKGFDLLIFTTNLAEQVIEKIQNTQSDHWVIVKGLKEVEEVEKLCLFFDIDMMHIKDAFNPDHLPKIEEYNHYLFAIMSSLFHNQEGRLKSYNTSMFLGKSFVMTLQDASTSIFDNVVDAFNGSKKIISNSSDYLFNLLLNNLLIDLTGHTELLVEKLQILEEKLFTFQTDKNIGKKLQQMQRDYMQINKSVSPLKEQFNRLLRVDNPLIQKQNLIYYYDINDHFRYVVELNDNCREMIRSLANLYLSNNNLRTNEIMHRLTVVSTIFIPLTFLTGVWGMNFTGMPELEWEYGYIFAWGIIVVAAIATVFWLKSKRWY